MNKKVLLLIIIIITGLLTFFNFQKKEVSYDSLIVNNEQWSEIINNKTFSSDIKINSLVFNNYELIVDKNNTWYYSLIEGNDLSYNPKVSFETNVEDANIIVLNNSINEELIKNNKTIKLIVFDDNKYNIYYLKCTHLPLISIEYNENKIISREDNVNINMFIFDNRYNATERVTKSFGKMHERGASSLAFPKKSYRVSLDKMSLGNNKRKNGISLLGERKDDDWILMPAYNDYEKVRNVFASNLWYYSCADNNSFNIKNGNEYKYIELFINGEYWGLYSIGFPIDRKQLNLSSNEYMFKKISWEKSELDVFNNKNGPMAGYEIENNGVNEEDAWKALREYYYTLQTSNDIDELYSISDIDNVIDFYLFSLLIQASDNPTFLNVKNVLITIKNKDNKKVALYTPWDLDISLGSKWNENIKNKVSYYGDMPSVNRPFYLISPYYIQKLGDNSIVEKIKDRYFYLRENNWSNEFINNLIDTYESQIYFSGAFSRDKARWPEGNYNDEAKALTDFRDYLIKRLYYMDEYINDF